MIIMLCATAVISIGITSFFLYKMNKPPEEDTTPIQRLEQSKSRLMQALSYQVDAHVQQEIDLVDTQNQHNKIVGTQKTTIKKYQDQIKQEILLDQVATNTDGIETSHNTYELNAYMHKGDYDLYDYQNFIKIKKNNDVVMDWTKVEDVIPFNRKQNEDYLFRPILFKNMEKIMYLEEHENISDGNFIESDSGIIVETNLRPIDLKALMEVCGYNPYRYTLTDASTGTLKYVFDKNYNLESISFQTTINKKNIKISENDQDLMEKYKEITVSISGEMTITNKNQITKKDTEIPTDVNSEIQENKYALFEEVLQNMSESTNYTYFTGYSYNNDIAAMNSGKQEMIISDRHYGENVFVEKNGDVRNSFNYHFMSAESNAEEITESDEYYYEIKTNDIYHKTKDQVEKISEQNKIKKWHEICLDPKFKPQFMKAKIKEDYELRVVTLDFIEMMKLDDDGSLKRILGIPQNILEYKQELDTHYTSMTYEFDMNKKTLEKIMVSFNLRPDEQTISTLTAEHPMLIVQSITCSFSAEMTKDSVSDFNYPVNLSEEEKKSASQ